ncbi:MAG: ABC transporter ATP-binding protein [Methanothrix sp.]|nr:MAG: ABC transporter ATP-binding protein [Methanothrix sp.]
MLRIRNLRVSFGKTEILRGINLDLVPGDSISLVGESGAGKTTLALTLMGLHGGTASGEIQFREKDLLKISADEYRKMRGRDMAMVFQNVEDALDPVYRVKDQIAEAILNHSRPETRLLDERVSRLLSSVGLSPEKGGNYPHQLSGGERQRVLIAMALANDPDLLILDEPTASLDALTKADIIRLFASAMSGRISLVITHDISLASQLTEQMAVLYAGRIVELGKTEDMVRNPRHPYTRGLIRSFPGMATTKDLQGIPGQMAHGLPGCPFHRRCTQHIEICDRLMPELVQQDRRLIACHRGGIVPLLQMQALSKRFGSFAALQGIDLTLFEGETVALVGESGSGKTTLSKIIMGLYDQDAGEIRLDGKKIGKRDAQFYRMVQMIFQNPKESVSHRMNILDAVIEPLQVQRIGSKEEQRERAIDTVKLVELPHDDDFLARYPHQLSGGEVQRVAIARALVLGPKLLIADEPTSALDPSVQAKILKLLMNLQEKMGLAILFVTHDIALARKVSDRMAVMLKGRIVEAGPTHEVLSHPTHPYTKRLVECASGGQGDVTRAAKPDAVAVSQAKEIIIDEKPLLVNR